MMSGDVQPRKRKEKRRKREDDDAGTPPPLLVNPAEFLDNIAIHVHKEGGTGGHWCARIFFFVLLTALLGLIGLIIFEYRGSADVDTPIESSRWAMIFDGWVDEALPSHDDDPHEKSAENDEDDHDDDDEEDEGHGDDENEDEDDDDDEHDEDDENENDKEDKSEETGSHEEDEESIENQEESSREEISNEVDDDDDDDDDGDYIDDEGDEDDEKEDEYSRENYSNEDDSGIENDDDEYGGVLEEADENEDDEDENDNDDDDDDDEGELSFEILGIVGVDEDDDSNEPLEEIEGEDELEGVTINDPFEIEDEKEEIIEEEQSSGAIGPSRLPSNAAMTGVRNSARGPEPTNQGKSGGRQEITSNVSDLDELKIQEEVENWLMRDFDD